MRPVDPHDPVRHGARYSVAVLALLLAACTGNSAKSKADLTPSTPSTSISSATPSTPPSTSATTKPSTTPRPTSSTSLGGDCTSVLPVLSVDRAVGKTVAGQTAFVVDAPNYAIGQVERVNCQYGLTTPKGKKTTSTPLVEVSVSLYDTSAHASARVAATKETWREGGAVPHPVTVAGHPGVVLIGHGSPLLVLGVGARTVAVSIAATLVTAARRDAVLTALAGGALRGAGG